MKSMRKIVMAAGALALFAAPALAAEDVMAGYYGNTAISTGGLGAAEIHTHYRADHTFDLTGSMMGMSRNYKGTWSIDGTGKLCRIFVGDLPPNTVNPVCSLMAPHKVGDAWTVTSKDGSTRDVTLKAGVQ
ncbi:MAG TPA: hypothetical protein VHZ78_09050 [Rhizomicrobium sp.]|jgi:hypothetical protein|nr:hypothetical protein [Rhizomicrobium sp.]